MVNSCSNATVVPVMSYSRVVSNPINTEVKVNQLPEVKGTNADLFLEAECYALERS